MDWMDQDLDLVIEDAAEKGLMLKAITKQKDFVDKYHSRIDIINVSVDSLGEGMDIEVAKSLKNKYNNVKIRAAIMKEEDVNTLEWVDIFTFNHARNGYKVFSKELVRDYAAKYPNKVCCETGVCETCKIKCGNNKEGLL